MLTELLSAQTIEAEAKEAVAAARGLHQVTLQNKSGTVSFECDESINANNLDHIVQKMAEAKKKNLNVKAINGFNAFSSVNPFDFAMLIRLDYRSSSSVLFARHLDMQLEPISL
jgi:hypothetical protein